MMIVASIALLFAMLASEYFAVNIKQNMGLGFVLSIMMLLFLIAFIFQHQLRWK